MNDMDVDEALRAVGVRVEDMAEDMERFVSY